MGSSFSTSSAWMEAVNRHVDKLQQDVQEAGGVVSYIKKEKTSVFMTAAACTAAGVVAKYGANLAIGVGCIGMLAAGTAYLTEHLVDETSPRRRSK